jgi:aminopeptidase N
MSKKVKRLGAGFAPTQYQLELHPDSETMRLTGTVTITGQKLGRPSQRLAFHQHGLKITSATIVRHDKKGDQTPAVTRINHQSTLDEVRLHSDVMLYPGQYTVTMTFEGKVQDGLHGVYLSTYEQDGQKKKLITTQFESHHAREAFPCIDEPAAKATFDLTLFSKTGEIALGNMPAKSQEERDGTLVTTFQTTPKMSTYLLAFITGDLHCKEAKTKDGVDVRVWGTKVQPLEAFDFGLDVAVRAVEFFNDYYGVPYPLSKCDHIAIPDFSSGAMENWGLITYRESCLLADPATVSQSGRELTASVICHELSHQWFGNLVTMKWWDDLWLNESFANVMEYVAPDSLFPEWHVWNTFITQEGLSALRRDSIAGVQAVRTEVRHPDEISSLFDPSIVYAKGGRLLSMLMHYVGEADFRKGLKAYFTKHAYGNTTGDDLWAALSESSGKDVAAFMNPWLQRSGFPVVGVSQQGTTLDLSQKHFLLDSTKADAERIWPVPLLSTNSDVPTLLTETASITKLSSTEYVRINQGAIGHYIVHYTQPAHMQHIAGQVSAQKLGVAERLMLLSDSSMLARAGVQSFGETLRLLEHYSNEDSEPVWDIMALITSDGRRFLDVDDKLEAPIKALLRALITPQFDRLGWEEKPGEPSDDTKLRGTITALGSYAGHEQVTQGALRLFDAYKADPRTVPAELRAIVFGASVRNKVDGAFAYLIQLEESTTNVDLKQDILGALTFTQDTAQVGQLLDRLKDGDKVRAQDVGHWLAFLLRSRYARPQAWAWLRQNWGWIEETFGGDKSYDYYPRYAASAFNTRELLEEYKAFFLPMIDQPVLTRNITMGIEELENRVAWLERDYKDVKAYFKA